MGNITTGTTRPLGAEEIPARIGVHLGAQRVELYRVVDQRQAVLVRRWAALGSPDGPQQTRPIPLAWFPWSLGNIRPEEYMFIRNAGALSTCPAADDPTLDVTGVTIADLGMSSVVHVPVLGAGPDPGTAPVPVGAVCAYWVEERSSWPSASRELVCDWARDAIADLR